MEDGGGEAPWAWQDTYYEEGWHGQPWSEEGEDGLRPFEGVLVEIHSCQHLIQPQDGAVEAVDANGLRGRACYWNEEQGLYIVRTFEGLILGIPEGNLREYDPGRSEDGGFDLAWPEHPDAYEAFAGMLCQDLVDKGYCVIQMFQRDERREEVRDLARARRDYSCIKQELEEGYLGRDAYSKVAWLEEVEEQEEDWHPSAPSQPRDALAECQGQLQELSAMLAPGAPELLGFAPLEGLLGTLLRLPIENTVEEVELDAGRLFEHDIADGKVEEYIDFVRRRRLCMMYLIDGEGGSIELEPVERDEEPAFRPVKLPTFPNKVLVFRHDCMRYAYSPTGADLVLQAWMAQEPSTLVLDDGLRGQLAGKELDPVFGIDVGVQSPAGLQDNIMSIACRCAAAGEDLEMLWTWLAAGIDTFTKIPLERYDMDFYYNEDGMPGTTSVMHGGLRSTEAWHQFDHEYFNMSEEDARRTCPEHRVALEAAFEALHRDGFTRDTLRGAPVWTYIGDSGSDSIEVDEAFLNEDVMSSGNRLMYTLGLTGTPLVVDTACSSSLVAASLCHQGLRERRQEAGDQTSCERRAEMGLALGICALLGVSSYIVLSGGGFLSPDGRCFTFNQTANGYARGEGAVAAFMKGSGDACSAQERLACFLGSDVNQDGRSASMTAPNGPSQQLCIKASINMAKLAPAEVTMGELHGTGTALGDPIEVGALCSVMCEKGRNRPLLLSSAKSNTGHLEACAGAAGFMKCVLMVISATGSSNCHLKQLNAHLQVEGCPAYFLSELCDTTENAGACGVASFGYGGTNARADVWARCRRGPRKTCDLSLSADRLKLEKLDYVSIPCPRCLGPMCWLCGMAIPRDAKPDKHHCFVIREDFAKYDLCSECFDGGYRHGEAAEASPDPGEGVFITGTWCAWAEYEEMARLPSGEYVAEISLGETCKERFNIALDAAPWLTIHPVEGEAGPSSRIAGPALPEDGANSRHWLIDGQRDNVDAGTVYRVTFTWGRKRKTIRWEATDVKRPVRVENQQRGRKYSVIGSWTAWKYRNMAADPDDLDAWQTTVKIGLSGEEEFHFARDQDKTQAIYPAEPRTLEPYVSVRGPDGRGGGRNWLLRGAAGEAVTIRLRIAEGSITVRTQSKERGERVWTSVPPRATSTYHIAGSWTGWALSRMVADEKGSEDVYRAYVAIGEDALEEFQIVKDRDWEQVWHPTTPWASPGEGFAAGPDAEGEGLHWQLFGPPGQTVEITLNLRSEDRRNVVSSRRLAWNEHPPALATEEEEWEERPYDLVIYGATGFVGRLMVQHLDALLSEGASKAPHSWAIAGRNSGRLSKISRSCQSSPGIIEARTPAEVADMASRCRVVVNASGPSAKTGGAVVKACVEQGTDYIDISTEHQWIREMIDRYHEAAKQRGVAIVCSVGQVSASFDIMCAKLAERLGPLTRIRMLLTENEEQSGGQVSSRIAAFEHLSERSASLEDEPFSLGGKRRCGSRPDDSVRIEFAEQDTLYPSLYLAPTGHGFCPERIIRRSCELFEEMPGRLDYGEDFQIIAREMTTSERSAEELLQQRPPAAKSRAARDLAAKQLRAQVEAARLPQPGQGPSRKLRALLRSECFALAEAESGRRAHIHHTAPASHEATALLCIAGALVLVEEREAVLPGAGGVVTPAAAFHGTTFAERAQVHAFARTDHERLSFRYADGHPDEDEVLEALLRTWRSAEQSRAALEAGAVSPTGVGPLGG